MKKTLGILATERNQGKVEWMQRPLRALEGHERDTFP